MQAPKPEPEPERRLAEPATVTNDVLDAAMSKAQQQQEVELDILKRPVIGSDDFEDDNDPLAHSASPVPQKTVLFNATSLELYRPPRAEQPTDLQRDLYGRPEPSDDELADLMPAGVDELIEQSELKQEVGEDEIDLDELDDDPNGPNFG